MRGGFREEDGIIWPEFGEPGLSKERLLDVFTSREAAAHQCPWKKRVELREAEFILFYRFIEERLS